ncbi:hypothetical protein JZU56_00825, partial [bacterium]|nr:hypothetical protein [bacterium]
MPDIVIEGPDGKPYAFPEGTSREVMRTAMRRKFPPPMSRGEAGVLGFERGMKPVAEFARRFDPLAYLI